MVFSLASISLASVVAALVIFKLLKNMVCPSPTTLPCLPSFPIMGSLLSLGGTTSPHLLFTRLGHKYGDLFGLYLGPHYTVVINNFKHAKEILLHKGKVFAGRPQMVTTALLSRDGKDIAFADYGPLWKFHRKLVHSAFTMFGEGASKLETIVCQEVSSLCSFLMDNLETPLDPGLGLSQAITNVVCTLVFNSKYQPGDSELQRVIDYNNSIVETIARGSLVDIFPWLKVFPNKDLKKLNKCIQVRDELLTQKLEEHKATYCMSETRDLMDALLRAQRSPMESRGLEETSFSDDHVLMIAADAFGAGVETTATTLKWMIAFLLHYPEVQKKIQQEIDEQIGWNRHPGLSDRRLLPYLECTLNEVLRIRPVAPLLIPHVALENTSIGEHVIPKGTRVVVNMWSIHHDPQEWEDPDSFIPERFLDSEGQRFSPPAFIPFGAGPRVCIGESLAKLELFLFTSWLLQQFSFFCPPGTPMPNLEGRYGVVLQPQSYTVCVRSRHDWRTKNKE
ncbi:CP17A lyase, partial [Polyodon spathula]|nr:steroid 17-alpha-hydroxylase/17,20 lyase-like [Polyodon spathula]MBN3275624.1 CP17A lyase [Polyodon spathula]